MEPLIARRIRGPHFKHLILLTLGLGVINQATFAKTVGVPNDATTLQAAIDAAAPGDEVLVMPGTYTGAGNKNLDLHQKELSVRSTGGAEVTTIDCEGSGRAFILYGALTRATLIEGFTITNGNGNAEPIGGGGMIIGGGSPTIRACVFRTNQAISSFFDGGGGGLTIRGGSPLIDRCDFIQNSVARARGAVGGGLSSHESTPVIQWCRFIENTAFGYGGGGGGIYVHLIVPGPQVIIENCEFTSNQGTVGGGAVITGTKITHCTVKGNTADGAAGMSALFSEVRNCDILENVSRGYGGGIELDGYMADCLLVNNLAEWGAGIWSTGESVIEGSVIMDNQANFGGGGLLVWPGREPTTVRGCTFARNQAPQGSGLMFSGAYPPLVEHRLENSIVFASQGGMAIEFFGFANATISCTDLYANKGGDWVGPVADRLGKRGNMAADPRFCRHEVSDFQLAANSPCLPGNHPQGADCGLIGALEEGCGAVVVEATTWGQIKAQYRERSTSRR